MPSSDNRSRSRRAHPSTARGTTYPPAPGARTAEELLGPLNDLERLNAPTELFVAGDSALLRQHPRVSVVGSRNASPEGLRRATKLARVLTENAVTVVSGLALGIDTAAHEAAMTNRGRTIAVIGTPLNKVYPAQNAELQERIATEHLVVSQFAPGRPVTRANFPMRNRTMALIVDASVIVEAGETSGSLSQGWEALRLARELFIMKSVFENTSLRWPEKMLEYGARVLEDPEQLLDKLPYGEPNAAFSVSA
jgi:DNA processing protein